MKFNDARYNLMELMVCVASRQLEDGKTAVIGTGMPLSAAMLAQKMASPNLVILFEAGGVAPKLQRLPISVADSNAQTGGLLHTGVDVIFEACQRGTIDYTFLGGAQIDMYGNINSSMIGTDYYHPKVRLPGSGGANDLGLIMLEDAHHHTARQAKIHQQAGFSDLTRLSHRPRRQGTGRLPPAADRTR